VAITNVKSFLTSLLGELQQLLSGIYIGKGFAKASARATRLKKFIRFFLLPTTLTKSNKALKILRFLLETFLNRL
jgi:hypothetical protein